MCDNGWGYVHSYHIANSAESHRLSFSLSRSTDPVKAAAAAREIVSDYAEGTVEMIKTNMFPPFLLFVCLFVCLTVCLLNGLTGICYRFCNHL